MAANVSVPESAMRFSSVQEEALLTILRSADCLHRSFQQRLKPYGLTSTQYNVLRILRGAQPRGLICSAVGRMMITPEPDITRLLARLKAQKLVTQQRDKHDRRIVWTHLSQRGVEMLAQLDATVEDAPRELLSGLNCGEVAELIRLLGKASCCEPGRAAEAETAPLTGKPPLPHSRPTLPLRHHPE